MEIRFSMRLFFVLGLKCDKNAKKCRFLRCVRTQVLI